MKSALSYGLFGAFMAMAVCGCGGGTQSDASPDVATVDMGSGTDADDVQTRIDVSTDTDRTCTFIPGSTPEMCMHTGQICMAAPITCDGGMVVMPVCTCETAPMFIKRWSCHPTCT